MDITSKARPMSPCLHLSRCRQMVALIQSISFGSDTRLHGGSRRISTAGATQRTALVPRLLAEKLTTTLWNSQTRARSPAGAHATMFEYGTWAIAKSMEDGASDQPTMSAPSVSPATTLSTAGKEQSRMSGSHFPTGLPRRSQTSLSETLAIIKAFTTTETPL